MGSEGSHRAVAASSILVVLLFAAGVAVLLGSPAPRPGPDAAAEVASPQSGPGRPAPNRREERSSSPPPATPASEDLWAEMPTGEDRRSTDEEAFRLAGGIRTAGTDPEAARLAVTRPGWAEQMEEVLGRALRYEVLVGGAEVDRLSCVGGRCLIELRFESMRAALERAEPLREWLGQRVECAAYSDGPDEGESPSLGPSQQVWILCGEPPSE